MSPHRPSLSVIIPTTCESRRSDLLRRALDSIRDQDGIRTEIIVVANGRRIDRTLLGELERQRDIRAIVQDEGDLPQAIVRGREAVATAFFAYLDDDDEYLPRTLRTRLDPLLADGSVDVVVTPGYVHEDGRSLPTPWKVADARRDPLLALMTANWLASCGGMYRTASVSAAHLRGLAPYYEWTSLAFRLAREKRIVFLDVPTFRITSSPQSLSKSPGHVDAETVLLEGMLASDAPPAVRSLLRQRLSSSYHCRAENFRIRGMLLPAWRCHLKSLALPRGGRYMLYTRKLLLPHRPAQDAGSGNPPFPV